MHYFQEFGDLQPYETWKFRICSENVSGVFPELFRKRGENSFGEHGLKQGIQ